MTYRFLCLPWLVIALGSFLFAAGCGNETQTTKPSVSPPPLAIQSPRPPLELISGDGKFGSADFGELRSCTYRLRNNQSQAITLKLLDKSCTCTGVQLPEAPIEPGQEGIVILNWSPKGDVLENSSIRLWAEVGDAAQAQKMRLEATGTIEPRLMVALPRGPLDFGKLTLADLDQDHARLVLEVYSRQTSFPSPTCKFNMPGIEVLQTEPLTPDRLTSLNANSGYRLTIKPTKQLPHGAFLAQLSLQTSLKPTPLVLDLTGSLETSIISLSQDKLQLPPRLSLSSGYRVPALTINIRYGICKSCEIVEVMPKIFDARVSQVNDNTWRLELSLSKETSTLQQRFTPEAWQLLMQFGFDQGSVTLKLDHPDVKSLTIPITGADLSRE
jgi:Protein of unknown function (DUF1573)